MTIKNVVRTNNAVLSVAAGAVSPLASDPGDTLGYVKYHSACSKTAAWFEGRLWTFQYFYTGSFYEMRFRRWDNNPTPDTWENQPGFTATSNVDCISSFGGQTTANLPGLISFKDNVYLFWDSQGSTVSVSSTHTWGYMRWNPTPATNGTTVVEAYNVGTGAYVHTYTKTHSNTTDSGHILDLIEHQGNLYIATPINILTVAPPSGDVTMIEEVADFDNMVAKGFGKFKAASSAVAQLYLLEANGKVKVVSAAIAQVADLSSLDATIKTGNTAPPIVLGWQPAIVQVGSTLYAFLNNNTGTVLFSSTDGVNWTNITASLPTAWKTTNSHIKYSIDPSTPEVRIMFVNVSSGNFDIFSFDGSNFVFYGNGSTSYVTSYTYFDKDAEDVELEGALTVDPIVGTASFPYQIFREATATGIVSVAAEYSLDSGATWTTALAKTGSGTGSEVLTGLNASDSRPGGAGVAYTFVWDWLTQLGATLRPNVRFRIRSI